MDKLIIKKTAEIKDRVIAYRRALHELAELGGIEFKTHDYICDILKELNIKYETVGDTGIIGELDTGNPGPGIALRADIDALPIKENVRNLKRERSCISKDGNTCHACGHDAHTAMLLGSIHIFADIYKENPDLLKGKLYFCFEAGEENGIGSKPMLDALALRKIDTVWGIHVYSGLASGEISVQSGPRMGGYAGVDIIIKGLGGHASRPDKAINPVYVASEIVTGIPGLFINQLDANKRVTYAVTDIRGGTVGNIIPDTARILGTLRFFDVEEGKKAIHIVKKAAENIADLYNCKLEYGPASSVFGGPVINNEKCAEFAERHLPSVLNELGVKVTKCLPWYASDSYGKYTERYPGIYAFLGIKNEEYGSGAEHHNEYFDVDEGVLRSGVAATLKYAISYMEAAI